MYTVTSNNKAISEWKAGYKYVTSALHMCHKKVTATHGSQKVIVTQKWRILIG